MEKCISDLGHMSSKYDPNRITLDTKRDAVFFSWLANHRAPLEKKGRSDYMVGGLNEMRSRFDDWLVQRGEDRNPCISVVANDLFETGSPCDDLAGGKPCLFDRFGGFMTRLRGQDNVTHRHCKESVRAFLASDEMLTSWRGSSACRALAAEAPEWGFMTSFSREGQLGMDVSTEAQWSDLTECVRSKENRTLA